MDCVVSNELPISANKFVMYFMRKEILASVVLNLFLVLNITAQKTKTTTNDQQLKQTPQISLEENLTKLSKNLSDILIEKQLAGKERTNVAILDFVDFKGNSSEFGKFLAEELVTRLFETNKFNVIKASSSKNQRRVLSVDAIVGGTIGESDSNYRINVQITNAETGELVAATGATVVKDREVCSLVNCNSKAPFNNSQSTTESASERPPTIVRRPLEAPKTWKVDSNFFTFDLQRCRLSGTSVLCEFIITNNDKDRTIRVYSRNSVFFDDLGNQYDNGKMEIANTEIEVTLISGVPVKARLTFTNVSAEATKITKLQLVVRGGDNELNVEYRNIPLR
jgi:TolB-like protein